MDNALSQRIKYVGFIMTCLMVLYHCGSLLEYNVSGQIDYTIGSMLRYDFDVIGGLVMNWFFAVTGFLLFRDLTFKNYPQKIKKRIFSLLIPYVAWQVIFAIIFICSGSKITFSSFLTRTFTLVYWPVDGALWYMYAVFLMALFSPALLFVFKNKNVGWVCIVVLIVLKEIIVKKGMLQSVVEYDLIFNILLYVPSYLLGAFWGKFSEDTTKHSTMGYALSLLFVAFLMEWLLPGYLSTITVGLMPILILAFSPDIPALYDRWIYNITFILYAIHLPVFTFLWPTIQKICASFNAPFSITFLVARISLLLINIGIAAVIYIVLKKTAPPVLKILTGGRS